MEVGKKYFLDYSNIDIQFIRILFNSFGRCRCSAFMREDVCFLSLSFAIWEMKGFEMIIGREKKLPGKRIPLSLLEMYCYRRY